MGSINDLLIEFEDRVFGREEVFRDLLQISVEAYAQVRSFLFYLIEKLLAVHKDSITRQK
jgi:hypothetical protein